MTPEDIKEIEYRAVKKYKAKIRMRAWRDKQNSEAQHLKTFSYPKGYLKDAKPLEQNKTIPKVDYRK